MAFVNQSEKRQDWIHRDNYSVAGCIAGHGGAGLRMISQIGLFGYAAINNCAAEKVFDGSGGVQTTEAGKIAELQINPAIRVNFYIYFIHRLFSTFAIRLQVYA